MGDAHGLLVIPFLLIVIGATWYLCSDDDPEVQRAKREGEEARAKMKEGRNG